MPQPRAGAVARTLRQRGHEALTLEFTTIEPTGRAVTVGSARSDLARFDRVVFVSPSAVDMLLEALPGEWPAQVAPAVVGPGSREALGRHGLDTHPLLVMPAGPVFDAAAMLALPALAAAGRESILVVRAEGGNNAIEAELSRRGACVTVVEAYRRLTAQPSPQALRTLAAWLEDPGAARPGASGPCERRAASALRGLPQLVVTTVDASRLVARLADGQAALERLRACRALAIHPRIVASLRELGWRCVDQTEPGLAALLRAIESGDGAARGAPHRIGTKSD